MQTDQIVYSEKQKLDVKKWIINPMMIALGMVALLFAIPILYFYFTGGIAAITETFNAPFVIVTIIGALIPCGVMYLVRTRMKLELHVTKQGLNYKYVPFSSTKDKFIPWEQVSSLELKKYPFAATRPGLQNRIFTKGQEAIVMTVDLIGIKIKLKDKKWIYLTSGNPEELVKAIRNLNLNIQIIK